MADVRSQYEEYVASRERELCLYRSGLCSAPQLARVDEDFAEVTSGDVLDELARELEGARLESARDDLRRLLHVVQEAVISSGVRDLELRQNPRFDASSRTDQQHFDFLLRAPLQRFRQIDGRVKVPARSAASDNCASTHNTRRASCRCSKESRQQPVIQPSSNRRS